MYKVYIMKGNVKAALIVTIIVIITAMLFGCGRNYCQTKYPCTQKDSISYIEKYQFDTTYLPLPADSFRVEIPIDCPDQKIVYKDGQKDIRIVIKDRLLTVTKFSKEDSIRIINTYKQSSDFHKEVQVKEVVRIETKAPKWAFYLIGVVFLFIIYNTRFIWLKFIKFPI